MDSSHWRISPSSYISTLTGFDLVVLIILVHELVLYMQAQMFTSKFAPLFFVSSILLVLILQIYEIVEQKERGTIGLLTLTGLQYANFLVSW